MMFAVFTDASLSGLPNQRPTRSSSFTQKPTLASSLIEQKHQHAKITPIPIKEVVHGLIPYVQQQKIKGTTMMLVESRPAATPKSCSMTTASHLMIKARSQPMIKGIIPGKSRIFSDLGTSRVPTSSASLVSSDFLVQTTTTTTPTSLNASPSQHHDRNTLSLTQTWTHDNFKTLYRKATTTKTEVSTLTSQLVEQTVPAQGSLSSQVNEPTGFELPGLPLWTIWIFVPIITFGFLLAAKIYQDARRPVYPKRHQERGSNRYTGRGTTRDEYASSQEAVHNARTLAPNGIRRESDEGGSGSHGPVLHHEDLGSLRRMVLPASYRPDYHEPTHKKRYDQRGASTSSHYLGSPGYSTSSAFASPLQSPSDGIHRMSVPTTPVVANGKSSSKSRCDHISQRFRFHVAEPDFRSSSSRPTQYYRRPLPGEQFIAR